MAHRGRLVIGASVAAFATSALTVPLVIRLLGRRLTDAPNARSSHDIPTPTGGGLAIIAGTGLGVAVGGMSISGPWAGVGVGAVAMAAVGLADDMLDAAAAVRLVAQTFIALVALVWLLDGSDAGIGGTAVLGTVAALWIVGYTNAFNFMDGINGIASAQIVIVALTWVFIGDRYGWEEVELIGGVMAAAALGFLPWNFPRARVFMGDVGSYFAGAVIASVTVVLLRRGTSPVVAVAPLLPFVVDTAVTLLARIRRGEPWMRAHRSHIYQRAVAAGWSHTTMTSAYAVLAAACAVGGGLWVTGSPLRMASGGLLTIAAVGAYVLLPSLASRGS
jgi:UDP-N-acetylmuramyl pentapeptide phosphotransferase/UDP-N-acetylglucosamine-1-phosphate transferase